MYIEISKLKSEVPFLLHPQNHIVNSVTQKPAKRNGQQSTTHILAKNGDVYEENMHGRSGTLCRNIHLHIQINSLLFWTWKSLPKLM